MNLVKPPCDEGVIAAKKGEAPCSKKLGPWILAATILGSSMVFIDGTVVNVALPALQTNLKATAVDVQWVVEAYALLLAALLLLGGSLGDHLGRKRIYAIGIALFALASIWCGLAPTINQLILARGAQGIGGALLVPGSLAIISASFPEKERGRAIGTWSGATVATISLGAIVYGLIETSRLGLQSPAVLIALLVGVIALAAFIVVEARVPHPMMPLRLFRSRNFSGANLLTLFLYAALSGTLFFLPLNLIQVQRYTPTAAGAALLPFILIVFLLSRWSGGLVKRYGSRLPLVIGPIIAAGGYVLLIRPSVGGSYWTDFFPAMFVLGLGMAISVAPLTTTVMNSVKQSHAGIASGVNNAVSRTAGLLAIAVLGLVMVQSFNQSFDRHLDQIVVSAEARRTLDTERSKLAAAEIPIEVNEEARVAIKQAINDSFVRGFRIVMLLGAI